MLLSWSELLFVREFRNSNFDDTVTTLAYCSLIDRRRSKNDVPTLSKTEKNCDRVMDLLSFQIRFF